MSREAVDCVVIGAGVVGLAVARALAMAGREVIVLDSENMIGTGTSSRNSEVIHAGIYYPQNSLKALCCVAGKHLLYDYCESHQVPHRRCGKLIVASDDNQLDTLKGIEQKAINNGVTDLQWLDANDVHELEPALHCVGALLSPSTGIIDSHSLMLAYQGDAEKAGAMLGFLSPIIGGEVMDNGIALDVGGDEAMGLLAQCVVNSAGLYAGEVAHSIRGLNKDSIPPHYYAKGNYYTLATRSPFSRLIYPVPEAAGLGVHVTIDLAGQARFGPDVEWIDGIDYDVDPARADVFYAAIRSYWPDLPDNSIQPGYAGVRPKLQAPGEPAADFVIQGPTEHGVAGLVNLYGIESPGLTASLSIAERVAALLAA